TAGIVGPVVVNYIREAQISAGVPRAQVYDFTMYMLACFLLLGLLANAFIRPLNPKWFMSHAEAVALASKGENAARVASRGGQGIDRGRFDALAALAWAAVGLPLAWGVWMTIEKTAALFH
uniref:MFS transporter small subunit n=1 Tax=Sphingomonas sp. TaxID=28214 RepID=UPI003FA7457F